ncbi:MULTISPECIES: 50S ribosomal protein L13 [Kandleria]|jgi:large subunit ribosomal protein L13|nr:MULTISPECIES: 50S ribosomal protein L13 [Kandleria]MBP3275416.1 50S ribosomal protein L13 [Kandleria sp.]MEE0989167.1 50S ribosomal protein L13 [Kandleria vitulina]SDM08432.1 LSU ribosomal protein L13P [Kandleria vitulina]SEI85224.1 LSU ribosomal protein L13P [Kandleria vitulina]HAD22882.1 50S ribosomal protein L13 [Kandleria vitulina]
MRQTTMANKATIEHKWYVVDATDMVLGRLASQVATVLRGKHKPTYTPHVDTGDYVIIVNADKVRMTGNKLANEKYYHHTGWLGGLKVKTAKEFLEKDPTGFVEHAVKGMLPHNTLGRAQGMKLFVYAGPDHPHAAQKPEELKVKG